MIAGIKLNMEAHLGSPRNRRGFLQYACMYNVDE